MRRLNLDQLRAVTEVMRLGSFSAAARSLNLTQPAVSFQVRELEERLGLQLIERLGKRAYPTPAGTELIEDSHRIDDDVDDAMDAMRRRREGGLARVRIGTGSILLASLLPPVLRELHRKHPGIELRRHHRHGRRDQRARRREHYRYRTRLFADRGTLAQRDGSFGRIRCWLCCRRANAAHRRCSTRRRLRGIR